MIGGWPIGPSQFVIDTTFPVRCANPDLVIGFQAYQDIKKRIKALSVQGRPEQISLEGLYLSLFCDQDALVCSTVQEVYYFDEDGGDYNLPLYIRRIIYATMVQNDIDGDKWTDLRTENANKDMQALKACINGTAPAASCTRADTNDDGAVNEGDLHLLESARRYLILDNTPINLAIIGSRIEDFELEMFPVKQYTDYQLLDYCVRNAIAGCPAPDLNGDNKLTNQDLNLFTQELAPLDVNGNGTVEVTF